RPRDRRGAPRDRARVRGGPDARHDVHRQELRRPARSRRRGARGEHPLLAHALERPDGAAPRGRAEDPPTAPGETPPMISPAALGLGATPVALDEGGRGARDAANAPPPSPWPDEIALFAMRGETVAIQAVVESRARLEGIHAAFGSFTNGDASVGVTIETF